MASELSLLVAKHVQREGVISTALAHLYLYRYTSLSPSERGIPGPSICVVVQGAKQTMLGDSSHLQPAGDYMITPIDLPVTGNVVKASISVPFLGLRYDLDINRIASFSLDSDLKSARRTPRIHGVSLSRMTPDLEDVFVRLLKLLDRPDDIAFLEPLVSQEILYRLVQSGHADMFEKIVSSDGHIHRMARLINWLKRNVDQPLSVKSIAHEANMSSSVLYESFHNATGMSPIQFHKQLRLQEARRMLISSDLDSASAAIKVGYKSPSQFSREYTRLFGRSPGRDIQHFRRFSMSSNSCSEEPGMQNGASI
ncbi:MAG: AraC family transcriptional regulator [Edaphobacter sp.]|uniref:AraC family transcriptional regulator n=1 Tax=Edaphobacter sp. TaxID=1934404 RepID=UPI002391337D|nr:AraC family transcriptional regulator [Edaphobacter sp.]MDE1175698.1 AraC family transcriptional regulator [Edaphobacter sp.]